MEYVCCPLCGRGVRFERGERGILPARFREVHDFVVSVQNFLGAGGKGLPKEQRKGRGFLWSERKMTAEELAELRDLLAAKIDLLDDATDAVDEQPKDESDEAFKARMAKYVADGEQMVADAEAALAVRKREVEELMQRHQRKVA